VENQHGPWTDIYAFAGVLFRGLIGSDPDGAVARRHNDRLMIPAQFAERIPAYVINALVNAMQVFPEERTRTVEHLRAELSASPSAVVQSAAFRQPPPGPVPASGQGPAEPDIPEPKRRGAGAAAAKIAAVTIAVGLVVCGVFAWFLYGDSIGGFVSGLFNPTEAPVTTTAPPVTAPHLVDRVYDEALLLEYEDLDLRKVEQHHDTAEAGRIIAQDPQAGEAVRNGTIVLTVSKGPEMVPLPGEIEGRPYDDVRAELEALGFKVIKNPTDADNGDGAHQAGAVRSIDNNLVPGESYRKGSQVYLTVWGNADGTPLEGEPASETEPE
jgi:serine/threonine-protein kinase